MDAPYEEKSAWVTFISLLVVFGIYFFAAAQMLTAGLTDVVAPFVPLFIGVVVLLVIVLVAGHIIAALMGRPEARDERDQLIERRAGSSSGWILGAGVLIAVFCLALPVGRAWIANGLLMALVLSEIVNYGLRLFFYRRGV